MQFLHFNKKSTVVRLIKRGIWRHAGEYDIIDPNFFNELDTLIAANS